jgi:hypothetical protein
MPPGLQVLQELNHPLDGDVLHFESASIAFFICQEL